MKFIPRHIKQLLGLAWGTPADGDALVYNAATQSYEPKTVITITGIVEEGAEVPATPGLYVKLGAVAPVTDTTAPTITTFDLDATSASLTVPLSFVASDNVAVAKYYVSESGTTPALDAAGWVNSAPTTYTFSSAGSKTLYGWVQDAAGNISIRSSDTTTITLTDNTAPIVTAFVLPATSDSLTVPVTTFTATDNVAVTGYMVTTSASAPSAGAVEWSGTAPTTITAAAFGSVTFYAWAKDAAGNVSTPSQATTIITQDQTAPVVTAFAVGAVNGQTVAITSFTGTDNIAVTGYLITESSAQPSAGAAGWSGTAPPFYTSATPEVKDLYPWIKDAAGNVSAAATPVNVTFVLVAPSAPSNVTLTATDWDTLTVTWTKSASATSYPVRYGSATGNYTVTVSPEPGNVAIATISGLSAIDTIYVQVGASNAAGTTWASEVSKALTILDNTFADNITPFASSPGNTGTFASIGSEGSMVTGAAQVATFGAPISPLSLPLSISVSARFTVSDSGYISFGVDKYASALDMTTIANNHGYIALLIPSDLTGADIRIRKDITTNLVTAARTFDNLYHDYKLTIAVNGDIKLYVDGTPVLQTNNTAYLSGGFVRAVLLQNLADSTTKLKNYRLRCI